MPQSKSMFFQSKNQQLGYLANEDREIKISTSINMLKITGAATMIVGGILIFAGGIVFLTSDKNLYHDGNARIGLALSIPGWLTLLLGVISLIVRKCHLERARKTDSLIRNSIQLSYGTNV